MFATKPWKKELNMIDNKILLQNHLLVHFSVISYFVDQYEAKWRKSIKQLMTVMVLITALSYVDASKQKSSH